jgi:CBS domain containing-hemolysin-like protein
LHEEQIGENEYKFSARLEVDYINENYKLELPEGEEYETLGGLIVHQTGEIPEQDTEVTLDRFSFKILEVSNTKIDLVKVTVHTED